MPNCQNFQVGSFGGWGLGVNWELGVAELGVNAAQAHPGTYKWEGGGLSGLLSTAGNLLFTGDGSSGNFVALNATTGRPAVARRRPLERDQRPDHLHAGRSAVRRRRRGRYSLGVCDERVGFQLPTPNSTTPN